MISCRRKLILRKCGNIGDGFIILSEILVCLHAQKYKIDENVKKFCNKYNKKSLKILKQFKGYQKDLFINLLINSINRTH